MKIACIFLTCCFGLAFLGFISLLIWHIILVVLTPNELTGVVFGIVITFVAALFSLTLVDWQEVRESHKEFDYNTDPIYVCWNISGGIEDE